MLTVEIDIYFVTLIMATQCHQNIMPFPIIFLSKIVNVKLGINSACFKVHVKKYHSKKKKSANKNLTTIIGQVAQHLLQNDITWCANS